MIKILFLIIPAAAFLFFGNIFLKNEPVITQYDSVFSDTIKITVLFSGDVMQHIPQVNAAWDDSCKCYSYDRCFSEISPLFNSADVAVINLETTLSGEPYSGYPQFSSPDEIVTGLKNAGVDVLVTSNNHSCDKGRKGVNRTIEVIDSIGLRRTGTFRDSNDIKIHNPLFMSVKGIKIALLNYTYGTNGITLETPPYVNYIDSVRIKNDFEKAKKYNADIIIPFFHWGIEYQQEPNTQQKNISDLCFDLGTDLVVASHPHVIQPAQRLLRNNDSVTIAWSLGNFISNQRQINTDGGMSLIVEITKTPSGTFVSKAAYVLHYVSIESDSTGRKTYNVIPLIKGKSFNDKADLFAKNSRQLLDSSANAIGEMNYDSSAGKWVW